jgi:hypothetical protein
MPNWCHNSMEITGSIDEIVRFKQTCIRIAFEGEQAQLDFNAIKPMPDFGDGEKLNPNSIFPAWYDWACEHWGTKWNACGFHVTSDESGRYVCHFDTAWSPPVPIWEKLGKMFPALDFVLSGYEPNMDFAFRGTIKDGKLVLLDAPVIWETIDPKTGETISGTRDEVEDALGENPGVVMVSTRAGES